VTSPADRTQAPSVPAAPGAFEALQRELDRVFPPKSEPRQYLAQPLEAVRSASYALVDDPEAKPVLADALDVLEDVLEALMRAAGWPTGTLGRGEPVQ
jgi:hypothetical protein